MFSSYFLIDRLPEPIREFIRVNKIQVTNPYGEFGRGVDNVFFFLTIGLERNLYRYAVENLVKDDRFTPDMRNELAKIILDLTQDTQNKLPADYPQKQESTPSFRR